MNETRRGFLGTLAMALSSLFSKSAKSETIQVDDELEFVDFSQLRAERRRASVTLDGAPVICFQASPKHGFVVVPSCGCLVGEKMKPAELDWINGSRIEKRKVLFGRVRVIWPNESELDDSDKFVSGTWAIGATESGWFPDWKRLDEESPEMCREVLVQLENGTTMPATRIGFEIDNSLSRGLDGDMMQPAKITHFFESREGFEIDDRVVLWAEFRAGWVFTKRPMTYRTLWKLESVVADVDGTIKPIDGLSYSGNCWSYTFEEHKP